MKSRPARDAWIETPSRPLTRERPLRRVPHGTRGLKPSWSSPLSEGLRRVPHGTRGLKQDYHTGDRDIRRSRPARDAWIETPSEARSSLQTNVASRTGRVD